MADPLDLLTAEERELHARCVGHEASDAFAIAQLRADLAVAQVRAKTLEELAGEGVCALAELEALQASSARGRVHPRGTRLDKKTTIGQNRDHLPRMVLTHAKRTSGGALQRPRQSRRRDHEKPTDRVPARRLHAGHRPARYRGGRSRHRA
jgi:hypothetical protein